MGNSASLAKKKEVRNDEAIPLAGETISATNTLEYNQFYDSCIMCLTPFGIQDLRLPYQCVNKKCARLYCKECIDTVQRQNGKIRTFRCMFCLYEYLSDKLPVLNQNMKNELWKMNKIKHGIGYTRYLLLKTSYGSLKYDLLYDIECRLRHLMNLISTLERYTRLTQNVSVKNEAHVLCDSLNDLLKELKNDSTENMVKYQREYRQIISASMHESDIGQLYIRICEDLLCDISTAEFYRAFSKTHVLMIEWSAKLASNDNFSPQIHDLINTIDDDLKENWLNNRFGIIRTKIGIIGYTCAGKSTLVNQILGVTDLRSIDASPVRSIKSTYYPLQFDRKQPMISPDDSSQCSHVTLVDIQGLDKDMATVEKTVRPGNYLDEIKKADCDMYILISDEKIRYEQLRWIEFIEQTMKRKCLLVRSKVDIDFLAKFRERTGIFYGASNDGHRQLHHNSIVEQLRFDNQVVGHHVYLIAADMMSANSDAQILLKTESFDMKLLLDDLSRLAFEARKYRIHSVAMRVLARITNICFRRAYVLKVLNYKIGAGVAAIIPFGDQLPRYLARDHIRQAFGVNKNFQKFLLQHHLIIDEQCLQTSALQHCVTATTMSRKSNKFQFGAAVGSVFIATAPFSDDILRASAPTVIVLTGTARIALTATTAIIGVIISSAVCAWSAIDAGKHIFSYVNRLCDDLILVCNPLIYNLIESLTLEEQ